MILRKSTFVFSPPADVRALFADLYRVGLVAHPASGDPSSPASPYLNQPGNFAAARDFFRKRLKAHQTSFLDHRSLTVTFDTSFAIASVLRTTPFARPALTRPLRHARACDRNIPFIIPFHLESGDKPLLPGVYQWRDALGRALGRTDLFRDRAAKIWFHCMLDAEWRYNELISFGWDPDLASAVLPLDVATSLVLTFTLREWRDFFRLHYLGEAGRPHPGASSLLAPLVATFRSLIPVVFDDIVILPPGRRTDIDRLTLDRIDRTARRTDIKGRRQVAVIKEILASWVAERSRRKALLREPSASYDFSDSPVGEEVFRNTPTLPNLSPQALEGTV